MSTAGAAQSYSDELPPKDLNIRGAIGALWGETPIGMAGGAQNDEDESHTRWEWPILPPGIVGPTQVCNQIHCPKRAAIPSVMPGFNLGYFPKMGWRDCPEKCAEYGTCNPEFGVCYCIPGWKGVACQEPAAPACTLRRNNLDPQTRDGYLWPGVSTEYHIPCASGTPKTCACLQQCASLHVSFYDPEESPSCKPASQAIEILHKLQKCPESCSMHGWCSKHGKCNCFVGWQGETCNTEQAAYCLGGDNKNNINNEHAHADQTE